MIGRRLSAIPTVVSLAEVLQTRFINWVTRNQTVASHEITLHKRRIYILPTAWGYTYALTLLLMLLGAMNYNNSMAFAFTFLLVGMGLNAMWYTHRNLLNLVVRKAGVSPAFAGERSEFRLGLEDRSRVDRNALIVQWQDYLPCRVDIKSGERTSAILQVPAPLRGILKPGRFKIYSTFPVGLFKAWSWLEFNMATVVYPKPAVYHQAPPNGLGDYGWADLRENSCDDYYGLRGYRVGDPLKRIAWKALAATDNLMTKQFAGANQQELFLDWESLTEMEEELRLSVLCGWVLELQRRQLRYGLRLPNKTIHPSIGESHGRRCLEVLALYGLPDSA